MNNSAQVSSLPESFEQLRQRVKVLLLNGPPRCGKDTIAQGLKTRYPHIVLEKLALPLRECVNELEPRAKDDEWFESHKDIVKINGLTLREYMIKHYRETAEWSGAQWLANQFVSRLHGLKSQTIVVTDLGRQCEANEISYVIGHANVRVVCVRRIGCTFANDSREYVTLPYPPQTRHFTNVEDHPEIIIDAISHDVIPDWLSATHTPKDANA